MESESSNAENEVSGRLAKEALLECEERFRILLNAVNEGVIVHDKFRIIDCNLSFAALFGYQRHEIIGRDVLEFAAPSSRDLVLEKLLKSHQAPFEITGQKKNKETFAIELCSKAIPHRGSLLCLTLYRHPRKSVPPQQDKKILQECLSPLFDHSPDAYYLADTTGKLIDVNKVAVELIGYKKEDIIGMSFLKLHILDSDEITKAARNLALNIFGKTSEPEEYLIKAKDGRRIPVEIQQKTVQADGRMLILGVIRDVSEKKWPAKPCAGQWRK
jgi:PAS domain S-box-containing protein